MVLGDDHGVSHDVGGIDDRDSICEELSIWIAEENAGAEEQSRAEEKCCAEEN
jgi:hypothetical protein